MQDLDKRYQTLIVLWSAMLMNIGVLFVVSHFVGPEFNSAPTKAASSLFLAVFTAIGTFIVFISFAVKRKLLERSVEKQDVSLVQKALVIACALCEISALMGMFERFVVGNREYYILFLLGAVGTAFHFPRRDQLLAANYKKTLE